MQINICKVNIMKILLISNMYPSAKDKTYGTFVKMFKEGIERNTNDILFDCCFIRGRSNNFMVKVYKYFVFYSVIVYKVLFTKYDFIYNHQITHSAPVLRICRYLRKFKLVMNIHGSDVVTINKTSKLLLGIASPLLIDSILIVVPSEYFKNIVLDKILGVSPNQLFVSASGGVCKEVFTCKKNHWVVTNTIVYVSRIDAGKGWDVLLDAVSELKSRKEIKEKRILFVGYGVQTELLKKRIQELGLLEFCDYLGPKTHQELSELYNQADVMIFPTMLYESLGLVGLEAMACGCPVIGSNIGCLPEYIKDETTGFLFEPGNSHELANRIVDYYNLSDNQKDIMRMQAIKMAGKYDSDEISQRLVNKFKDIPFNI